MIYKIQPLLKQRLWGGNKLPSIYGINTNDKIGEAWILSCLKQDICLLDDGQTLAQLLMSNPEVVAKGYHSREFPLLIKLIDAQDDLSIQVHPSAKTEFWHVLNKTPSKLYMGFNKKTDKTEIGYSLLNGNVTDFLNYIDVKEKDSFLIEPGTVHAIGKGTFLIEIQQSADITYRLHDFGRVDANGKPRELHVDQALNCMNYEQYKVTQTGDKNHLISCKFFNVYRYEINDKISLNADEKSFHAITILDGTGTIKSSQKSFEFKPFDTFFIPANSGQYEIIGKATIIQTTL